MGQQSDFAFMPYGLEFNAMDATTDSPIVTHGILIAKRPFLLSVYVERIDLSAQSLSVYPPHGHVLTAVLNTAPIERERGERGRARKSQGETKRRGGETLREPERARGARASMQAEKSLFCPVVCEHNESYSIRYPVRYVVITVWSTISSQASKNKLLSDRAGG